MLEHTSRILRLIVSVGLPFCATAGFMAQAVSPPNPPAGTKIIEPVVTEIEAIFADTGETVIEAPIKYARDADTIRFEVVSVAIGTATHAKLRSAFRLDPLPKGRKDALTHIAIHADETGPTQAVTYVLNIRATQPARKT